MSIAASRNHAPSVEQPARTATPGSAFPGHRSYHPGDLNASWREESTPPAKSTASFATPSVAASDSKSANSVGPDIPPPPQSVASFAAPSVGPSDSVSQIGSRPSKSATRVSTRLRLPQETNGSHYSQGTNARSQASSARLTEANLHAHDAEPQLVLEKADRSEHQSQARTEHTARSSRKGQSAIAEELSGSQDFTRKAHSAAPSSRASTVKASQRDIDVASQAISRGAASKPLTEVSASKFENAAASRAGSKAATATPSQFNGRDPNGGSSHSESHASKATASNAGSKAGKAVPSHAGSKAQYAESSPSNANASDSPEFYSEPKAATYIFSESRSKAPSEALSKAESASPRQAAAYSPEGSKSGSDFPPAARTAASRGPSLRLYGSDSNIARRARNTYIVEVERADEQVTGTDYRIQRKHEYPVKD